MGLQWGDIDWDNLTVFIRRSATGKHIYETKTEGSSKPVPLDPNMAEVLLRHRERSPYKGPTDFVFAGESGRPRWRGILFADHIKPAAEMAGIGKIGWLLQGRVICGLCGERMRTPIWTASSISSSFT